MPTFKYQGRDYSGKLIAGMRSARSSANLSAQLFSEDIIPIQIVAVKSDLGLWSKLSLMFNKAISVDELTLFARQMFTLSKAGVPIISAIKHLSANSRNPRFSDILLGVTERLEAGQNLAVAMEYYPKTFTPLMIAMVRIGQNTGRLEDAFQRLTSYLELESGTFKRLKTTIRYPIFVMIALIVAVLIINFFVIPAFTKAYMHADIPLPRLTMWLIYFSDFVGNYWIYMAILLGMFVYFMRRYLKTPVGKYRWHSLQFRLPVVGMLLKRISLLRFAETFAVVLDSGIPINEGLTLVAGSINNEYARKEVNSFKDAIQHGNSIIQAASSCDLFTSLELQMLAIGEETGELGTMLKEIVIYYRCELDYDLKRLTDAIEPVVLVAIASMVLLLALAVYMPIWNMVKLAHRA